MVTRTPQASQTIDYTKAITQLVAKNPMDENVAANFNSSQEIGDAAIAAVVEQRSCQSRDKD